MEDIIERLRDYDSYSEYQHMLDELEEFLPKQGYWKNAWANTDKDMECSECNFIHKRNDYFKFCPNCGAKMNME